MRMLRIVAWIVVIAATAGIANAGGGTAFTYQGRLLDAGEPANGVFNVDFGLWDDPAAGSQIGSTIMFNNLPISDGLFTVELDFGANAFDNTGRWLEISVNGSELMPRQPITRAPYAIQTRGIFVDADGNVHASGSIHSGSSVNICGNEHLITCDEDLEFHVGVTAPCSAPNRALRLERGGTNVDVVNLIGGHVSNTVTVGVDGATIGGGGLAGFPNRVTGDFGTVGGGANNISDGGFSTVAGGANNTAGVPNSTVGGGRDNRAIGSRATIGGGSFNTASGADSTVGGGGHNVASGSLSTVGGGDQNEASGAGATIPGGSRNKAAGRISFAAGDRAEALHDGTFVWATGGPFASTGPDQFLIRAPGGVGIGTANPIHPLEMASGAHVTAGGMWIDCSDANRKENIIAVDRQEILHRVQELPISTWNFKDEDDAIRHIGPMAQDFHAAFGVGADDKHLASLDSSGVALTAIQGLYELVQEKDNEITDLKARLAALEALVERLVLDRNGGGP